MPEPRSRSNSSGRLLLRMPQTLHAELARSADREQVSLNGSSRGCSPQRWAGSRRTAPPEKALTGAAPRSRFRAIAILVNIVVLASAAVTLLVLALREGW